MKKHALILTAALVSLTSAVPAQGPAQASPARPPDVPPQVPQMQIVRANPFVSVPPEVDAALRDRVSKFYQCYLDSQFRKSEQFVAEDSKDAYYSLRKEPIFGFKILDLTFAEDLTTAKVTVLKDVDYHLQGRILRVSMPDPTEWRLENGQWVYYLVPRKPGDTYMTPFGPETVPDPKEVQQSRPTYDLTNAPKSPVGKMMVNTADATQQFNKLPLYSKPVAELNKLNNFHDQISLGNVANKPIKFHIDAELPKGVEVSPTEGELKPGQNLLLQFAYTLPNPEKADLSMTKIHFVMDGTQQELLLAVKVQPIPVRYQDGR
jgi:hypothetical protein